MTVREENKLREVTKGETAVALYQVDDINLSHWRKRTKKT
jgi:hypothetical protein